MRSGGRVLIPLAIVVAARAYGVQASAAPQTAPGPHLTITAAARAIRPGELVVLTVVAPNDVVSVKARAFARDLPAFPVDAKTWRVLVGIDLETAARIYSVD